MYYYILEQPGSRAERQSYQRLRDILTNLGIAGEMVSSSPARTPEELTLMGIQKGYTTIVAVGGDAHVNQVATSLRDRAVLGIIPIDAGPQIVELVGGDDYRNAALTLKYRKLSVHNLILIEPETLSFLNVEINSPNKLAKVNIVLDNRLRLYSYFNHLSVDQNLELDLESIHVTEPKKLLGLFNVGGNIIKSASHFNAKLVKLVTDPEMVFTAAGKPIARTPALIRILPEALKIISKRGIVD